MNLDREAIKRGVVRDMVRESVRLGLTTPLSEEERIETLRVALAGRAPGAPLWLFGYGSLMWNPAFHFAERRTGLVHGYHPRYFLWTPVGRGSPQAPGLTLGLDRGGSCPGVAFRIAAENVSEELDIVWSREMIGGSYKARWVAVRTARGTVRALTFTTNRGHTRYAGALPSELVAAHLATARGPLGSCAEYLENTVDHLRGLGIRGGAMHDMLDRVRAYRGAPPTGRWEDGRWITTIRKPQPERS